MTAVIFLSFLKTVTTLLDLVQHLLPLANTGVQLARHIVSSNMRESHSYFEVYNENEATSRNRGADSSDSYIGNDSDNDSHGWESDRSRN